MPEITGDETNEFLFGADGADTIAGNGGDDYMGGHGGDDLIAGGAGRDIAAYYLPQGTPGSFRTAQGTGAEAGSLIVERVDGATVEAVFRITPNADGSFTVTGLGSAADQGTDTVTGVEELHFMVPQDPFNPDQFINVNLAPSAWVYEPNHHVGVNGTPFADLIDLAGYHQDKDASWQRFMNGGDGNDTLIGGGNDEQLYGNAGDDLLQGGAGRDVANYELAQGLTGQLRTVPGAGANALVLQRVDGATVEDLFVIAQTGAGSFTVTGLGAYAGLGTDTLQGVEGASFYVPNAPLGHFVNLAPSAWVDDTHHNVGVEGTAFGDSINLADHHQDKDASWNRFANGREGNDTLAGASGDDQLTGGSGDDLLQGGGGRDVANYELAADFSGTLRTVPGAGATAGALVLQRVDGATVEDLFVVAQTGQGTFTVTGLGAYAGLGADRLEGVEGASFYVPNTPIGHFVTLSPEAWVYEPNHHVGVNGTPFADLIDLAGYHQDKDASWTRFGNGGDGNDTLIGGGNDEQLHGNAGDDLIQGGGGRDVANYELAAGLTGQLRTAPGAGANAGALILQRVDGATVEDLFVIAQTGQGTFTVTGLGAYAGLGTDTLQGVEGASFYVPNTPLGHFVNLAPSAWVYEPNHNAGVDGTPFADQIDLAVQDDKDPTWVRIANGFDGADAVQGSSFNDLQFGGAGGDSLSGAGGADTLHGQDGDDRLEGGEGADRFFGGRGADTLMGGAGDDVIILADGNLAVPRVTGDDVVDGGDGFDVVSFWSLTSPLNVNLWSTGPQGIGGGSVALSGVEGLEGGRGDDNLQGDDADNWLSGGFTDAPTGNDFIFGNGGDDVLIGRDGDDYLAGGAGDDFVSGGAGRDVSAYHLPQGTPGSFRTAQGTGADAGSLIVERVDGATVEAVFRITPNADGSFTVTGLGSAGDQGTDTVTGVEELHFMVPQDPFNPDQFINVNLAPSTWVDETHHNVGVNGGILGDLIDLAQFHTDKDASWNRFGNGGDGNDTLVGTLQGDNLAGDAGADSLNGGGGDDYLRGGGGNDAIDGGAGRDIAAFSFPAGLPGTYHQVEGTGADAGKLFIERRHEGGAERVFEITLTGSGATLQATVTGLGSAAGLGTDIVRGVEELHFATEPFDPALFVSVRLAPFTPPLGPNAFVDGSVASDLIDLGALYPTANAGTPLNANGRGGDDTLIGHDGANNLTGEAGNDSISGRGGDDLLRGGNGRDTFDGGAGTDRISFYDLAATQGVEADLATGAIANDGFGNAETMTSIEGLGAGTQFVDKLYGNDFGNVILGGWKDIVLGRGGDDLVQIGGAPGLADGGAGRDTLVFTPTRTIDLNGDGVAEEQTTTQGVRVDLALQLIQDDGFGQSGQVMGFEVIGGTIYADTISGDSLANELMGIAGADSLYGQGGDDVLFGGAGNDTLAGGAGADTALFSGARAGYTVTQTGTGWRVVDTNAADGDEGTDELSGVELLQFADGLMALQTGVAIGPPSLGRGEGNAGVTFMDFLVTRTGDTSGTLTLPYTISGSGLDPIDSGDLVGFTGSPLAGQVTFAAGASTATIRVSVVGDMVVEGTESFTVSLAQPATGSVEFIRQVATGTIINDDNPVDLPPGWGGGPGWGDPHLVTMDGLKYEMQGVGEFVLVESVQGDVMVQFRTEAVNAYASEITAVATRLGSAKVSIDAESDTILVDGQALTFAPGETTKAVGDGSISLYSHNGAQGWLIKFADASQAGLIVLDMGDRLDFEFRASPDRSADFRGLIGDFDGSAGNDLVARGGSTPLTQPVSFSDFYGTFVNSWRISDAESLFTYAPGQSTATFTDPSFPPAAVTLADFPSDLVAAAEAAAREAGVTDPALLEAVVKDYLLTGDRSFISSGSGVTVTTPPVEAKVEASTQPIVAVGVGGVTPVLDEGQSGATTYAFKVYRTDGAGAMTVGWNVSGAVFQGVDGAADAADFGGALPVGSVTFADGQTEAIVLVNVSADTVFEGDEGFVFSITPPGGVLVLSGSVQAEIANDDAAPTAPPPPPPPPPPGPDQNGGNGSDTLVGTAGAEKLDGGNGSDRLDGLGGDDRLFGGNGSDTLLGGAGDDRLEGGNGGDNLIGGAGDDTLTGDNGPDVFVFGAGFGHDRITDFDNADQIRFQAGTFTNFDDVKSHAQQVGDDVVITDNAGNMLTLLDVSLKSLGAGDFIFG